MATYTNRSAGEISALLDRFAIVMPHVLIDAARKDLTQEHHAFGDGGLRSGVIHVWLHAEARHDSNGAERFTLSACSDHDDDFGCCDVCGRWRNKPASDTWHQRTTDILAEQIMKGEAGQ